MKSYDGSSTVETIELQRSGKEYEYVPTEKIRIIEVDNFPLLGKLTAFRFIEWVLKNPGGVISLRQEDSRTFYYMGAAYSRTLGYERDPKYIA